VNDKSAIQQGLFDFTDRALSLATNGHSTAALFNLGPATARRIRRRDLGAWQSVYVDELARI
jgi:hypothetical protein